jgi:hypothetical protein
MEDNVKMKAVEDYTDSAADPEKVAAEQKQLQDLILTQRSQMEESLSELDAKARENSWRLPSGVTVSNIENDNAHVMVSVDTDEGLITSQAALVDAAKVAKRLSILAVADGGVVTDDKNKAVDLSLATKLELARLFGGESVTLNLDFDAIEEEEDKSLILPYGV